MDELKPCPFCGAGEYRIDPSYNWTGQRNQLISVKIYHWCDEGPRRFRSTVCVTGKSEEEARAQWNRRTPDREET